MPPEETQHAARGSGRRKRAKQEAVSPAGQKPQPLFEILRADDEHRGELVCAIYPDGKVEGFPYPVVTVNRIPAFLDRLVARLTVDLRKAAEEERRKLGA